MKKVILFLIIISTLLTTSCAVRNGPGGQVKSQHGPENTKYIVMSPDHLLYMDTIYTPPDERLKELSEKYSTEYIKASADNLYNVYLERLGDTTSAETIKNETLDFSKCLAKVRLCEILYDETAKDDYRAVFSTAVIVEITEILDEYVGKTESCKVGQKIKGMAYGYWLRDGEKFIYEVGCGYVPMTVIGNEYIVEIGDSERHLRYPEEKYSDIYEKCGVEGAKYTIKPIATAFTADLNEVEGFAEVEFEKNLKEYVALVYEKYCKNGS